MTAPPYRPARSPHDHGCMVQYVRDMAFTRARYLCGFVPVTVLDQLCIVSLRSEPVSCGRALLLQRPDTPDGRKTRHKLRSETDLPSYDGSNQVDLCVKPGRFTR